MSLREPMAFDNVSIFEERAAALLSYTYESTKPSVAVWGVMNAGKSYLLNMLTDHVEVEYFPTKDVRETAELKTYEGHRFQFLDTPGLDANSADDALATAGADVADLVMFVHQPIGELDQLEIDSLRKLKMAFGENAEKCIILVLSKVDAESREKIIEIEARVKQQLEELLDFRPRFFQVSGTRFHKGVQQHQDGLIRASHVDELRVYLESLCVDLANVRKAKHRHRLEQLLNEVKGALEVMGERKVFTQAQLDSLFNDFNHAFSDLTESLDAKCKSFRNFLKSGE
ncbi:GTPase [Shewanella algae]|uniref:GTPase n=1 Tax=Shewanella algae TaxID=38313 RepID=UPI00313EEA48